MPGLYWGGRMLDERMIDDVRNELQKDPIVYESVRRHMEDNIQFMKTLGRPEMKCFPNDMVTTVGAPENQRRIIKRLINKYGSDILSDIIIHVYRDPKKEDWREKMR
jgi:N-methylhydantoinase B/oxoprolinase/acetone carboxylase alpha subunit